MGVEAALLPHQDSAPMTHKRSRRKTAVIFIVALLAIVALAVVLCLAFLWPRSPVVTVVGVDLNPFQGPPVIHVTPSPALFIPLRVIVTVQNDNFYSLSAVEGSRLEGVFSSSLLGRNVTLGESFPIATVPARSLTTLALNVTLRYAFFQSHLILAEMAAQCARAGTVSIVVELDLVVEALVIGRRFVNSTTLYEVPCSPGSSVA